ncbi:MAG: DUF1800 domain-containing protein [Planctomycetota bacterium]
MSRAVGAQPGPNSADGAPARLPSDLSPLRDEAFGYEHARRLLWRAGFGGTPKQIATLAGWGLDRAVDHLVRYDSIPFRADTDGEFDANIMREPTEEERAAYRRALASRNEDAVARFRLERQRAQRDDRRQMLSIRGWWLERLIETPRPLEEKLTLFWHGHFATSYRTIENSHHMLMQNRLFRKHAAGNFGELLRAIIRDPAMLAYLDNNDSSKREPNENLARELMELFSLGEGNYSERDIQEGARALTGYTFRNNTFYFNERNHDGGSKSILGVQGTLDGDDFVRAILARRDCPLFVASKLYRFFVADLPTNERDQDPATRAYVRSLAGLLAKSKYELGPVLRAMFRSRHFYEASDRNEQIKSPVTLAVGAIRSLNAPPRSLSAVLDGLDRMGQSLFYPPSVKGWDGGRAWINTSTLFVRQNLLVYLLTGAKPGGFGEPDTEYAYDPSALLASLADAEPGAERDADRVAGYLLRLTLGRSPAPVQRRIAAFVREHGGPKPDVITGALLLVTAMPEYQLC